MAIVRLADAIQPIVGRWVGRCVRVVKIYRWTQIDKIARHSTHSVSALVDISDCSEFDDLRISKLRMSHKPRASAKRKNGHRNRDRVRARERESEEDGQ